VTPENPTTEMIAARETKKHDGAKPRLELIDPLAELGLAMILTLGAAKYAVDGWRALESEQARIHGALKRHQNAILRGEFWDDETGMPHAVCLHANTMFLAAWAMKQVQESPTNKLEGEGDGLRALMGTFTRTCEELRKKYAR
jgi:hypothetical protein